MEEDDEPLNFIQLLLNRDLTRLCFQIFNELNSHSITNCRLVCQVWKEFIDYNFYQLPRGKKYLKQKLYSNFFNDEYTPRELHIDVPEPIFDIFADEKAVFISTEAGKVSKYEFHTLKHVWTLHTDHRR